MKKKITNIRNIRRNMRWWRRRCRRRKSKNESESKRRRRLNHLRKPHDSKDVKTRDRKPLAAYHCLA